MYKFIIDPKVEPSKNYIINAIQDFSTRDLPKLNRNWNYYCGKQKITKKKLGDETRPSNIVVNNFCYNIVDNFSGYLTGIPISYTNDDFQPVLDVLRYNDTYQEDADYLRQCLIFGRNFEVCYVDEESQQRFKLFDPRQCIPVYSNTLNSDLLYVIRFYTENTTANRAEPENYFVELYGPTTVKIFKSSYGWSSLELIDEYQHFYNQCPVTVFSLNTDEEGIFDQVVSLQDAYNKLISSAVDDQEAFSDAYLVLKGVIADADDLTEMKRQRVLGIDTDADASYLTKDLRNETLQFLLETIKQQIHTISLSPDFTDKEFMAQSGEAIKYKLVGFENKSSMIRSNMTKALQRRIELLCSVLRLTDEEGSWRDVKIDFTANLPNCLEPNTIDDLIKLRAILPDREILAFMPYVSDVDKVLAEKEEQDQKEMEAMYQFGGNEQE